MAVITRVFFAFGSISVKMADGSVGEVQKKKRRFFKTREESLQARKENQKRADQKAEEDFVGLCLARVGKLDSELSVVELDMSSLSITCLPSTKGKAVAVTLLHCLPKRKMSFFLIQCQWQGQ